MAFKLYDYQLEAVHNMKNGCVLCGGVGSGKSRTALAYYYLKQGGDESFLKECDYVPMDDPPEDLYIITTARKRDTLEWEAELSPFLLSTNADTNLYRNKIAIDSWNNIKKYKEVKNSFFIFDEQRVIGSGAWVKAFLQIVKTNRWILLSATPGDTWMDYVPVFIANGFYKNRTAFLREHVIFSRFSKFPKIERYFNEGKLIKYKRQILVTMDFQRKTISHHETIYSDYDVSTYKEVGKTRWNIYKNQPIINAAELCYIWRRIVNSSEDRKNVLMQLFRKHPKMIVFYNFDYELDILKGLDYGENVKIAEWNGHKHQPIPKTRSFVYLVQYAAGAEGWNCVSTDTLVFYSQNYSYKIMQQAAGRIDRLNTPFKDLYYYHLKSKSGIDLAISKALKNKQNFNENRFVKW